MTRNPKKFLARRDDDGPHIGKYLDAHLDHHTMTKADLGRQLQVNHTTLSRYFRQPSIHVGILWRMARVLQYNFFMDMGERLNIPYTTQQEKNLLTERTQLLERITLLESQVTLLKDILKKEA